MKRWQRTSWPRGKMVEHPAVLAEVSRNHGSPRAQLRHSEGVPVVIYQRTRVFVDRDAWEMLPPAGVLLMRVRPKNGDASFDLAFTPEELENVFGEVRETRSWDEQRCYHFPNTPPAVTAFRVTVAAGSPGDAARTRAGQIQGRSAPTRQLAGSGSSARVGSAPLRPPRHPVAASDSGSSAVSRLEWARRRFEHLGVLGETSEYLQAVEAWRNAWRPEKVKVLLLAESHVAEALGDARVRVKAPAFAGRSLPPKYVRLVYCLGYGDDSICAPRPITPNRGTPDFWEIFESIAATGPRHAAMPLPAAPRARKVMVLERLAERGIWLEDASPIGIYQAGGATVTNDRKKLTAIERQGYMHYVWPGVADDAPDVWTIGRTVARALHGLPGIRTDQVLMQPSYARRAGVMNEYRDELGRLCEALAETAP